jgi:hypothetical protein
MLYGVGSNTFGEIDNTLGVFKISFGVLFLMFCRKSRKCGK